MCPLVTLTGAEYLGLSAAEVLSFSALHRACEDRSLRVTTCAHTSDTCVLTGAEYLGLSAAEAAEVLSFSALHRACEEDVYLAAMRWLGHDPEGRRPHLATLLRPVRFALMDEDFFRRRVKHSAQFRGNRALQSVFEQVVYYMNHPNR